MKKLHWFLLSVMIFLLFFAALLSLLIGYEESHIVDRVPLDQETLDKLEARLKVSVEADTKTLIAEEATENLSPAPIPQQLKAAYPREKLQNVHDAIKKDLFKHTVHEKLVQVQIGINHLFGNGFPEKVAYEIAEVNRLLADLDAAHYYYQRALTADLQPRDHRLICSSLAWYEQDPQKAAQLLELSVLDTDNEWNYINAVGLCRATGSTELEAYYLTQFRLHFPEEAERRYPAEE